MRVKNKMSVVLAIVLSLTALNLQANNKPHTNVQIATAFFESIVNKKDFSSAAEYIGDVYVEHDPQGEDGPSGLKHYIEWLQNNFPESHVIIKRVISDGDYVIFHVHSILTPGTRGQAIVDMFRLDKGKVVEHWDVTQEIPESSANSNGMF